MALGTGNQTRLFRHLFVPLLQEGIPGFVYFLRSWHGEGFRLSNPSAGSNASHPRGGSREAISSPLPSANHGRACLPSHGANGPELAHIPSAFANAAHPLT